MAKVITNKEINLEQLDRKTGGFGLCLDKNDANKKIVTTADESQLTQAELENAVNAHNAIFAEPTIEEKLASVGLSVADLKNALGL